MKKNKKRTVSLNRDNNIILHLKGEISLKTKVVKDKTKFNRNIKHKKTIY